MSRYNNKSNKGNKGSSVIGIIFLIILAIVVISGLVMVSKPVKHVGDSDLTASLSLLSPSGSNVDVGQMQSIKWISRNYMAPTVSLHLIKKTGDNPDSYELVRTISSATTNDGDAIWVPAKNDQGDNIFVEVGCAKSTQACQASESSSPLAVVDNGLNDNTASAYQAIEQSINK